MKRLILISLIAALITPVLVVRSQAVSPLYDIAIINGRIIDGTGNPWFYGSVAIKDGLIAGVGKVDSSLAARVIDAQGSIIAPGFIDVHTHVEGSLDDNPSADNFLHMGVTSLVTGTGLSTGTLAPDEFEALELRIKVGRAGPRKKSCVVTATSQNSPSLQDTVLGVVKVKR